jgi:gas vesicle protein
MFFDDEDDDDRRVVYVERGGSSVKALLLGALIGAGIALLYAPQSGEETRRGLKRRLRKVRAMAEEKVDELGQRFSGRGDTGAAPEFTPAGGMAMEDMDDEDDVAPEMVAPPHRSGGAREELERRLEQARARRRGAPAEEPRA